MKWYFEAIKKYAVFNGRARRREYWMFHLFNIIIAFLLVLIVSYAPVPIGSFTIIPYTLAVFLPGIAVGVRRLHDTDRSGWWLLIGSVPIIGVIVLLVFMVEDSWPGENQYGPNPKGEAAS